MTRVERLHHQHRSSECGAPSDAVTKVPEDDAADGSDDEAQTEDGERGQQPRGGALFAEELGRDGGGKIAVEAEVVPLDEVADGGGGDGLPACLYPG